MRPLGGGRLRGEERPHAVTRRRRHGKALDSRVEIELVEPRAVLHGIDHPQRSLDPEHAEILDIGRVMRLDRRLVEQKFNFEHFAIRQ